MLRGSMADTIRDGKVAGLSFVLKDDDGDTIDGADADDPLLYLHGAGNLVPGIEDALNGKAVGDSIKVSVPPEAGYGPREDVEPQAVPRGAFPEEVELEIGMPFWVEADDGAELELFVVAIDDDEVMVDVNHPLAGMTLHFEATVLSIRDATAEEREHGHPHDGECGDEPPDPSTLN